MESQENVALLQKNTETKENVELVQKDSETKEIDALVQKESEIFLDLLGNSQVTKKILKRGKVSAKPRKSNICTLNIKELLADGTIISENQNFIVQVGDMEVVPGKKKSQGFNRIRLKAYFDFYRCRYGLTIDECG